MSLPIAAAAFHGVDLEDAKLGLLTETVLASALTWSNFKAIARRGHCPELDRIPGPKDGLVTVVES